MLGTLWRHLGLFPRSRHLEAQSLHRDAATLGRGVLRSMSFGLHEMAGGPLIPAAHGDEGLAEAFHGEGAIPLVRLLEAVVEQKDEGPGREDLRLGRAVRRDLLPGADPGELLGAGGGPGGDKNRPPAAFQGLGLGHRRPWPGLALAESQPRAHGERPCGDDLPRGVEVHVAAADEEGIDRGPRDQGPHRPGVVHRRRRSRKRERELRHVRRQLPGLPLGGLDSYVHRGRDRAGVGNEPAAQ
mmetsp:Transcript_65628/g.129077  ORF Transcript_65628/g.129077 Transcript_65628/m.129077 type:complete len:242 (-) Transcript_65628:1167-1892(-)